MEITYLGHSSFRIKSKSGILVTDPYDPAGLGVKYPRVSANVVTVSHDHSDHNFVARVVPVSNEAVVKVIWGPGEYEIAGISMIGIPSFHDDKKGEIRGKNIIFVFEIEDFRLAHLGDLGHKLSDSDIEKIGDIDILMIPVGGVYTIGPTAATEVVKSIEPKITVPMHYNDPRLNQETFGQLESVDVFLKEMSLPTEVVDKLTLKGSLTEEQKVVQLKPLYG